MTVVTSHRSVGFSDDEDALAGLLGTFVRGTLPLTLLWAIISCVVSPRFPVRTCTEALIFCSFGVGSLVCIRRGRVKLAARLMSSAFWCVVAWTSFHEGGVRASSFPALAAIILMTSILWSSSAAFVMALLSAALGAGFVWLAARGLLPKPAAAASDTSRWLACCLIFGTVATLQRLSARTARQSLSRAKEENLQRQRVEAQQGETLRALEQSEKRFRNIFESAAVALFEVDLSGLVELRDELRAALPQASLRTCLDDNPSLLDVIAERVHILDANEAGLRLVDLARKEALLGPLGARFRPDNRKDVALLAAALVDSAELVQHELSIVTFSGRKKRVVVTGRGSEAGSRLDRLVLSAVDVTEQRQLEARSRSAQRLEAIGRLAGGVAHDFNNALVVIMSWASLLRRPGRTEAERNEGLDAIGKSAARAAELTRQLLSIGRRGVHAPHPTDVGAIIDDTVRAIKRLLPADIELKVDEACREPAMVNEGQLQQVLLNLALNARDAMPEGGVLEFCTRLALPAEVPDLASDGRFLVITVSDTGVGMDAVTQERIFEPFFTTKSEGRGTGLGLATAHAIVIESRGKISVESQPGRGTSFHVYLPIASDTATPRVASAAVIDDRTGRGRSVLLVEDEVLVRNVLVESLRAAGYLVLEASDGARALELARAQRRPSAQPVDLLCTDGILPGMATRAFIDEFMRLFPSAPVLVCSGHVEEELVRRRIERGELSFLPKPFTPDELVERLGELLRAAPQVRPRDVSS